MNILPWSVQFGPFIHLTSLGITSSLLLHTGSATLPPQSPKNLRNNLSESFLEASYFFSYSVHSLWNTCDWCYACAWYIFLKIYKSPLHCFIAQGQLLVSRYLSTFWELLVLNPSLKAQLLFSCYLTSFRNTCTDSLFEVSSILVNFRLWGQPKKPNIYHTHKNIWILTPETCVKPDSIANESKYRVHPSHVYIIITWLLCKAHVTRRVSRTQIQLKGALEVLPKAYLNICCSLWGTSEQIIYNTYICVQHPRHFCFGSSHCIFPSPQNNTVPGYIFQS